AGVEDDRLPTYSPWTAEGHQGGAELSRARRRPQPIPGVASRLRLVTSEPPRRPNDHGRRRTNSRERHRFTRTTSRASVRPRWCRYREDDLYAQTRARRYGRRTRRCDGGRRRRSVDG